MYFIFLYYMLIEVFDPRYFSYMRMIFWTFYF